MPRRLPALETEFELQVVDALRIAEAGELARAAVSLHSQTASLLTVRRLEALYEMAFLRIFVGWEVFLEEVFLRYLCGYVSSKGQLRLTPGAAYAPTLKAAENVLLGTRTYLLWHNPTQVLDRCRKQFDGGQHYELVVSSSVARLEGMSRVRHRIAHGQSDAIAKFNGSTLTFAGKQYPAASAGRFLRDWVPSKPTPTRWLYELSSELVSLAKQII